MNEEATRELREAVEALASKMAPDVVAEARREAEERARMLLAQEMTRALVSEAEGLLSGKKQQAPPPRARPPTPPPAAKRPPDPEPPAPADEPTTAGEAALGLYLYGIVRA